MASTLSRRRLLSSEELDLQLPAPARSMSSPVLAVVDASRLIVKVSRLTEGNGKELRVIGPGEPMRFISVVEDGHRLAGSERRERLAVHTGRRPKARTGGDVPHPGDGAGNQGILPPWFFFDDRKKRSADRHATCIINL